MFQTLSFPSLVQFATDSALEDAVLSVPIMNNKSSIIGVAQLVKHNKIPFSEIDIQTMESFSVFCGLGIHSSMSYESALKLTARQKISLEVLVYHASSTVEETVEFMVSLGDIFSKLYFVFCFHRILHLDQPKFTTFTISPLMI